MSGKLQEPARSVIQCQKGSTWPGVQGLRGHYCIINSLAFIWDEMGAAGGFEISNSI